MDTGAGENEVMEADRAFAREVAAADAVDRARIWAGWFAAAGRQVVPGAVVAGRAEILALMSPAFGAPGYDLSWEPDQGGISADRTMGWTSGRYTSRRAAPGGGDPVLAHGRYVTIWARQSDGSWKVSLDTGVPD